jgi:hypothetical protein
METQVSTVLNDFTEEREQPFGAVETADCPANTIEDGLPLETAVFDVEEGPILLPFNETPKRDCDQGITMDEL